VSRNWTGTDGWPRSWPELLEPLLRTLDSELEPNLVAHYARKLAIAAEIGRDADMPGEQMASRAATNRSLEALFEACEQVTRALDDLRRPARLAIQDEGIDLDVFGAFVARTREAARHGYGYTEAPEVKMGRNPAREAAIVTQEAAQVYLAVTGKKPSITRHPRTHKVSGHFVDFLTGCFAALYIKASPESQIAALREKKGPE
jgi:hypothetical protein